MTAVARFPTKSRNREFTFEAFMQKLFHIRRNLCIVQNLKYLRDQWTFTNDFQ